MKAMTSPTTNEKAVKRTSVGSDIMFRKFSFRDPAIPTTAKIAAVIIFAVFPALFGACIFLLPFVLLKGRLRGTLYGQSEERIHVSPRFDGWEPFAKKLVTRTRDLSSVRLPVTFAPPTKHKDRTHIKILALDLGKFNSTCCFFDTKTRKARFLTTPTQREYLTAVFSDNKADLVVMASCGPSGWINDLAQPLGFSTLVCSTNYVGERSLRADLW